MSEVLVDTNVLLDVLTADSDWQSWSAEHLKRAIRQGAAINPLIYAEVSVNFATREDLDDALEIDAFEQLPLPWHAAFLAGKAYRQYRREGGVRRSPMPDFYIAAHATASNLTLLTRDVKRYRAYFPEVDLIHPNK